MLIKLMKWLLLSASISHATIIWADQLADIKQRAEQGDVVAQNDLGTAYVSGNGVIKDYDQARKWFQSAAEKGIAIHKKNIQEN